MKKCFRASIVTLAVLLVIVGVVYAARTTIWFDDFETDKLGQYFESDGTRVAGIGYGNTWGYKLRSNSTKPGVDPALGLLPDGTSKSEYHWIKAMTRATLSVSTSPMRIEHWVCVDGWFYGTWVQVRYSDQKICYLHGPGLRISCKSTTVPKATWRKLALNTTPFDTTSELRWIKYGTTKWYINKPLAESFVGCSSEALNQTAWWIYRTSDRQVWRIDNVKIVQSIDRDATDPPDF